MKKLLLVVSVMMFVYLGCQEEAPLQPEGNAEIVLKAYWDTTGAQQSMDCITLSNAKVILTSEYGASVTMTDDSGRISIRDIPSSVYNIAVRKEMPDLGIMVVGNHTGIDCRSGSVISLDIFCEAISGEDISINEIYSAGPVNNVYYFYDQFIELYNQGDSVRYLDGMMVYRISSNRQSDGYKGSGADEHDDGDIDGVTYVFGFPGEPGGTEYPIHPGQYVVLAQDAANHTKSVPGSIDLSQADWEFVNQFSVNDIDNPNVPNLSTLRTDRTVDFMISLTSDVIVISDGRDRNWEDGIDIETILDGVEYHSSLTHETTLERKIDRGLVKAPPKYSGQSMQRREPGVDTNDGTLDWEVIETPTPGYQ